MNDLLLHPHTQIQLDSYLSNPSHAITIVAPAGSGKHTIAESIAAKLLNVDIDRLLSHPYYKLINSIDGKAISIESIRELEHFLSLKVPNNASVHRVIIIEDAETLTIEAQNAFLKTLEEPPQGTIFVLTATHEQALLPTIRSRSPRLMITRPEYSALKAYFDKQFSQTDEVNQALLISGGLPGLTSALLSQNSDHPLLPATEVARQLLGATKYQRLLRVDELVKDKPLCLNTLFILQQMAHLSLLTANSSSSKRWLNILKSSYQAQTALLANNQAKLVLTNLMLRL